MRSCPTDKLNKKEKAGKGGIHIKRSPLEYRGSLLTYHPSSLHLNPMTLSSVWSNTGTEAVL